MSGLKISVNGIIKLLQCLKPDKAPGLDRIWPTTATKTLPWNYPNPSDHFLQVPGGWVLTIWMAKSRCFTHLQKGDKSSLANYRPISLTCILCKIFEHIVASNLVKHLDLNQILSDLQHVFRLKGSCETQLTMPIKERQRNLKEGKQTDIILLDFSKNSKWVWSGNTTITNCRQPRGTTRKSRSTITRHQEDKLSKAISSLFPIKMIAILEWT